VTAARALAGWAGARPGGAVLLLSHDPGLRAGMAEATGAPPLVVAPSGEVPEMGDGSVDLTWLDLAAAPDTATCLAACARVTRPGGRLVVRAPAPPGLPPQEAACRLADALAVLGLREVTSRVTLTEAPPGGGAADRVARAISRAVPGARALEVAAAVVARGTVPG
jgi:hypothetical protein